MSASSTNNHRGAAQSGLLAAAICMAITQILGLVLQPGNVAQVLMIGLSLSTIAFGGTYAAVFFVTLAGSRRRRSQGITAAP
jgi:tetrahydromethanopterin S-methyltransferase subunit D